MANKKLYKTSIIKMRLKLAELQKSEDKAQKIRIKSLDKYKNIDRVLHYQELLFVSEIIQRKLISKYHNDFLVGHFGINKSKGLIGRKYYWPSLRKNVEAYVKGYDFCLALKTVKHRLYSNLQALEIPTYQ